MGRYNPPLRSSQAAASHAGRQPRGDEILAAAAVLGSDSGLADLVLCDDADESSSAVSALSPSAPAAHAVPGRISQRLAREFQGKLTLVTVTNIGKIRFPAVGLALRALGKRARAAAAAVVQALGGGERGGDRGEGDEAGSRGDIEEGKDEAQDGGIKLFDDAAHCTRCTIGLLQMDNALRRLRQYRGRSFKLSGGVGADRQGTWHGAARG